jgi:hypothetical protein
MASEPQKFFKQALRGGLVSRTARNCSRYCSAATFRRALGFLDQSPTCIVRSKL